MTHVVVVNYAYAPDLTEPDDLIARYVSLVNWAAGLQQAGARVTVMQSFGRTAELIHQGVRYSFVSDDLRPYPRLWQIPHRLHRLAAQARPDAVHVNGLLFPAQLWALRRSLPPACPSIAQHHAERPFAGLRALIQRRGLRAAAGFFFAARTLAQPWRTRGLIAAQQPIFEIMEGSTTFDIMPRPVARTRTGLTGDPVFVWAGNLDANKDPLTVLTGFELALPAMPAARLYMVYRSAGLLPEVQRRIAQSSTLAGAVTLVGTLSYAEMERFFNSADFFLQGSHYEGSGYALCEALACGVVPIVTDIPSFRVMTNQGAFGALWPVGDAEALAAAIQALVAQPWSDQSQAARRFFDARLSIPAIGRQALAIYESLARP